MRALATALLIACSLVPLTARADTEGPTIVHEELKTGRLGVELVIVATITDESGVFDPVVLYRVGGEGEFLREPLTPTEGEPDRYTATIAGAVVSGDIEYFLEAFDNNGNGPSRYADESLPVSVQVLKTAEPLPDAPVVDGTPPADGSTVEEDEGLGAGVWIGVGAGVGALVVGALVVAGVAAFLLLREPPVPNDVTIKVTAPTPTSGGM